MSPHPVAVQAIALHEEGMGCADIARRIGVPYGRVWAWLQHGAPDVPTACGWCDGPLPERNGARGRFPKWCSDKCRKIALYSGQCRDCETRIDGASGLDRESVRCVPCDVAYRRKIGREYIIESIHEWVSRFGEPPTSADWNPSWLRWKGTPFALKKLARFESTGRPWPYTSGCQNLFGSFAAALRAAGYEPVPSQFSWMGREAYEAMLADRDVAA